MRGGGDGHGRGGADDDGDLVSDGIVTWRRKLPDLGELGRTTSTVDYQVQPSSGVARFWREEGHKTTPK